jgi:chemotaxis protein MotA
MEIATLLGIVVVFGAVVASLIMEGASPTSILLMPPIILVFVGSIGAAMAGGFFSDMAIIGKQLMRAFTAKEPQSDDVVEELVAMADTARREGLLALEERARTIEDPFLREGIEMTVDGTDADEIYDVLHTQISTVIGLIHVLGNLGSPEKLGELIASAFVATLWGVMSANALWLPISSKLKRISESEIAHMELLLEGVLAIQSGTSPRVVEKRLRAALANDGSGRADLAAEAA